MATKLPKREKNEAPTVLKYIPHGVNSKIFRKLTTPEELEKVEEFKTKFFGDKLVDFVVFYNNRNIRRKMTSDVILAFYEFTKKLPKEARERTRLLMHTQPVDENGTHLPQVVEDVVPDIKHLIVFSTDRVEAVLLNCIYNLTDVVINMASNEGFGIATLEGMMAERMIVANVTGGLQDQMGFVDDEGNPVSENIHFNENWDTNALGTYRKCGSWCKPAFPNNRALIGSCPTPYIFDDRCDWNNVANLLKEIYDMTPEERQKAGEEGRKFAIENFDSKVMNNKFIQAFDYLFENWKPRPKFGIYKP